MAIPYMDNLNIARPNLYLHASSVEIDGKAFLFLGHSSSGKSTISQLLSRKYPIIADDKVWIYEKNREKWFACNAHNMLYKDNSNTESKDTQKDYPVGGFFRIFKSNILDIQLIPPQQLCGYLLDAVFEVEIQREEKDMDMVKDWFKIVVNISKKYNGWHLTFSKDNNTLGFIEGFFKRTLSRSR